MKAAKARYRIATVAVTAAAVVLTPVLAAQTPPAVARAAEQITSAALQQRLKILTADSFSHRRTPSAALERMARYLVTQFQAVGLQPVIPQPPDGTTTGWLQRYPVPGRRAYLDSAASQVFFVYQPAPHGHELMRETGEVAQHRINVSLATAAHVLIPRVPQRRSWDYYAPAAVMLTGRPTDVMLRQADLAHKAVLYVPPADLDSRTRQSIIERLYQSSLATVVLEAVDSANRGASGAAAPPLVINDAYLNDEDALNPPVTPWAVGVRTDTLATLLGALGIDPMAARAAAEPALRPLPELHIGFIPTFDTMVTVDTTTASMMTAPNVAGILRGSDQTGVQQCLVVTAPLDDRGLPNGRHASWERSANAASLAALLELARAVVALPERPKYSIVFLATSGGAPDQAFWGSRYYLLQNQWSSGCELQFNLTIDFAVGGPVPGDSVRLAGLTDIEVVPPPAWVAGAHPELALAIADGGTVMTPQSDAFAFSQRAVPNLMMPGEATENARAQPDTPAPFDVGRASRQIRFAFYLVHAIAESATSPAWTVVGRQRAFGVFNER